MARSWAWLRRSLVAAAAVHPLMSILSRYSWWADLVSHFQVAALVTTLVALGFNRRASRGVVLALGALAVGQTIPLVRYMGPNPVLAAPASAGRFRVLMANIYHHNNDYEPLARLIETERPDAIGIVEYSTRSRVGLERVRRLYPYRTEYEDGAKGIALWLQRPPRRLDPPYWFDPDAGPVAHAEIEMGGRPHQLWICHPTSPIWPSRRFVSGNPDLTGLAAFIASFDGSRIIVGDMNTTEGSAHFFEFMATTGTRDSRYGFGRQPSWPEWSCYRIPIDHAFVSSDLAVVERRLGPFIGSDHFPLILEVGPAASASSQPGMASSAR